LKDLKAATFIFILFLVACDGEIIETNMSEEVSHFEFTTQDEHTLSLADLEGQWWIADFVYTNCTRVCPRMTANMANVQSALTNLDLEIQIVSFSIDPDYDTPEVLKEYAGSYDVDLSTWSFLTGYDFETIKSLSIDSFKTTIQEPSPGNQEIAHGTSFFLINPEGKVIKRYDGLGTEEMELIIEDLQKVL